MNNKIEAFLADIVKVCKKHKLTVTHEDCYGAFQVENYQEDNISWLMDARDFTKNERKTNE